VNERNVDVATKAISAFNGVDVDAFAALTTPDFEWSPSMAAIEGETFVGREGIEMYFRRLDDAWEKFHIHADRFRHSADRVIMLGRLEGRGKSSGVPVDAPLGMIFDLRDAAISRIRGFLDHDETLSAGEVDVR
jgi:ketosteroid isomerase-like protein